MSKLKIYGVPRSRAIRVMWLAEELGLDYDLDSVMFGSPETRTGQFMALNPMAKIPVIDDGGFVLWESMAINLYLAEKHGGPLWPGDPQGRAKAAQWSFWAIAEVEKPALTALFNRVLKAEEDRDTAAADAAEAELERPLAALERSLEGRDYLLGDEFTVADLNASSVLLWVRLARVDLGSFPTVKAWTKRCTGRPALQKLQG